MRTIEQVLAGTSENHIAPFLWVHGEEHEEYRKTIEAMHEAGIGALCIEARPHPDFNGEGWFSDIAFILKICKALDMKVWLLDDSHFPTGYADGAVMKYHPERRKRYLKLQTFDVMGPLAGSQLDLKYALMDPEAEVLAVIAERRSDDDTPIVSDTIDLTPTLHERADWQTGKPMADPLGRPTGQLAGEAKVVDLDLPEGAWYVQVLTVSYRGGEKETEGFLNPLEKEAPQVLLDTVYEPIFEHIGNEFGKTFQGFFSDEPRFGNIHGSEDASIGRNPQMVLPWSDEVVPLLIKALPDELGIASLQDLLPYLPLLFVDGEGDLCHTLRYAYMDVVSALYSENFDGTIADWCHAHHVRHIGHTIEDNNALARLGYGAGHYFRALAHADMAGIDVVMQQLMPGYDRGLFRAFHKPGWDMEFFTYVLGKIGGSLAHIDPKKQGLCMAEVFGAYGWGEGNRLMKWIADYMLVRGVNVFVPHAFNPKAFPDGDCPPHFYAHGMNPQYREFGRLMAYVNRTAALLSGGSYNAPVALYFNAEGEWSGDWQLAQKPAAELARHQIEYDFVSADWLLSSELVETEAGLRLEVGKERFSALVLPWSEALPEALLKKVAEISKALPAFFVDGLPVRTSEGHPVPALNRTQVVSLEDLAATLVAAGLRELAPSADEPWLRTYHYVLDGVDEYFLVNEHPSKRIQCRLEGAQEGYRYCYDGFTNELVADPDAFALDLAPYGSKLILVSKEPLDALPEAPAFEAASERTLGSCTLATSYFEEQGCAWSEPETLAEPVFVTSLPGKETFCGMARYTFNVTCSSEDLGGRAFLELAGVSESAHVYVNGKDCGCCIVPDYRFEVGSALVAGSNTVVVELAGTLGRAMDDFVGQFLPLEPFGMTGAKLIFGR